MGTDPGIPRCSDNCCDIQTSAMKQVCVVVMLCVAMAVVAAKKAAVKMDPAFSTHKKMESRLVHSKTGEKNEGYAQVKRADGKFGAVCDNKTPSAGGWPKVVYKELGFDIAKKVKAELITDVQWRHILHHMRKETLKHRLPVCK